tara:strand:- start:743 stop:892 length:150 start_codon:yes stop_codon:yes gene_type:complete
MSKISADVLLSKKILDALPTKLINKFIPILILGAKTIAVFLDACFILFI